MKNRAAIFFIVLFVLGCLPVFQKIYTGETEIIINVGNYTADSRRLRGNGAYEFKHFVKRSHIDILIIGDDSAILICI